MWQFCQSAWRAGFRSRAIHTILVLGLLLVGLAFLSASFSPRQPKTIALDVGLSGLRFSLVLFALFWVQEFIASEIERRTVIFSLTFPVDRNTFVIGRYFGVLGLLALAATLLGVLLWLTVQFAGGGYDQTTQIRLGTPFWMTVFGLWVDAALVAAFALWISTLSTVTMLPIALGAAFAIGGKSLGAVVDYLTRGADGDEKLVSSFGPLIDTIQWVLPDLSRLDWRSWPMYGVPLPDGSITLGLVTAIGYGLLMLALAVLSFSRREFS